MELSNKTIPVSGRLAILWGILVILIAFFPFLSGKFFFIYNDISLDTYNSFYPQYVNGWRYLKEFKYPTWSFYDGLGEDISIPSFVFHPLLYPFIFSGPEGIPYGITVYLFLEIMLSFLLSAFYFRLLGVEMISAVIGGLMMAFCGFSLVSITMHVNSLPLFILYIVTCEIIYRKTINNNLRYTALLMYAVIGFLVTFYHLFYAYFFTLVGVLYLTMRFYSRFNFLEAVRKAFVLIVVSSIFLGIGLLLTGPVFLSWVDYQRNGARTPLMETSFDKILWGGEQLWCTLHSAFTRIFSANIQGHFLPKDKGIRGIYECYNFVESPQFFSTLLALVLFIPAILSLEKQLRRSILFGLIFVILYLVFGFIRAVFFAFYETYFRDFNYFASLLIILPVVFYLDRQFKEPVIKLYHIVVSSLFWAILLFVLISIPEKPVFIDKKIAGTSLLIIVAYTLLLTATGKKIGFSFVIPLLVIFSIELIWDFYSTTIRYYREVTEEQAKNQQIKDKGMEGYDPASMPNCSFVYPGDYSACRRGTFRYEDKLMISSFDTNIKKCIEFINTIEKSKFYRIVNNIRMYFNENKIIGYYTSTTYRSVNSRYLVSYLLTFSYMDSIELTAAYRARWIRGFLKRSYAGELLNHCYYIIIPDEGWRKFKNSLISVYDSIYSHGRAVLLRHKFRLPYGYTYSYFIPESEFKKLPELEKDIVALNSIVVDDASVPEFEKKLKRLLLPPDSIRKKWNYDLNLIIPAISNLARYHLQLDTFSDTYIKGRISIPEPRLMYLSFPYYPHWKLYLNGKKDEIKIVNGGMAGILLDKGNYTIELKYEPAYLKYGWIPPLVSIILILILWLLFRHINIPVLLKISALSSKLQG